MIHWINLTKVENSWTIILLAISNHWNDAIHTGSNCFKHTGTNGFLLCFHPFPAQVTQPTSPAELSSDTVEMSVLWFTGWKERSLLKIWMKIEFGKVTLGKIIFLLLNKGSWVNICSAKLGKGKLKQKKRFLIILCFYYHSRNTVILYVKEPKNFSDWLWNYKIWIPFAKKLGVLLFFLNIFINPLGFHAVFFDHIHKHILLLHIRMISKGTFC